jgi:hypothetical protein
LTRKYWSIKKDDYNENTICAGGENKTMIKSGKGEKTRKIVDLGRKPQAPRS